MKSAAELRQGSTYRKDNVPYLILKAERHQSTSGKRQRAAEVKFNKRFDFRENTRNYSFSN